MRSQGNGGYTFTRKAEFVPSMLEKGMMSCSWNYLGMYWLIAKSGKRLEENFLNYLINLHGLLMNVIVGWE